MRCLVSRLASAFLLVSLSLASSVQAQYSINGTVTVVVTGAPLGGVCMSGLPGTPYTNTDGFYATLVPFGWSGTITPTLPGYSFTPVSRAYNYVHLMQSGEDYTATPISVHGCIVATLNDGAKYSVNIQLRVNVTTGLGGATLSFTYNTAALGYPANPLAETDYAFASYSGGNYGISTVTRPSANLVSVHVSYNGPLGAATPVNTTFTDVVTITFTTLDPSGSSDLTWVDTQVLADDHLTPFVTGSFTDLSTSPLPIELRSFRGEVLSQGVVKLVWSTASETQNYGFEVERSTQSTREFSTLQGSFVSGHGTTIESHDYSYVVETAGAGQYHYRLKQIDLDGTAHFSDPIQPSVTGNVEEAGPPQFTLRQNYPNPFNPSTTIRYDLPNREHVKLTVFNTLGQSVSTVVNGEQEAGSHEVRLDGSNLTSGVYFYGSPLEISRR
jgi:hypothetical protein